MITAKQYLHEVGITNDPAKTLTVMRDNDTFNIAAHMEAYALRVVTGQEQKIRFNSKPLPNHVYRPFKGWPEKKFDQLKKAMRRAKDACTLNGELAERYMIEKLWPGYGDVSLDALDELVYDEHTLREAKQRAGQTFDALKEMTTRNHNTEDPASEYGVKQ